MTENNRPYRSTILSFLLAFVVVAIWGVTFICTKKLLFAGLLPAQIFFIRFTLAYIGIVLICLFKHDSRKLFSRTFKDELIFLFLGLSGGSMYFLTENTALSYTQASNVSFIVCSAPLLTILLTLLWKRLFKHGRFSDSLERIYMGGGLLFGTILAIVGMAMVFFDGEAFKMHIKGDIMSFLAALTWGFYSLFMGQMVKEYGTFFSTRKVFFYGLVTILPFLVGKPFPATIFSDPSVISILLFLGLVASLLCFVLWNVVLSSLGHVTATNFVYLNPLFTLVTAMTFLDEKLTLVSGTGCIAILLGVILASSQKLNHRQ